MNSNKDTTKRKSTDKDNLSSSQNNNLDSDLEKNKDSISDSDLDTDIELDPEQSEASRYNDEEFLNSKRINKHDQPTEQRELTDEEKASIKKDDNGNKNRIVN